MAPLDHPAPPDDAEDPDGSVDGGAGPEGDASSGAAERFTVGARRYRVITAVALAMICAIVVTGAAVRLTGSGLGCETWPNCSEGELLEFGTPNQTIEQVNRLFTGFVSLSVIAAVLGSLRRRPYRRDLVWWSLSLVAGVLAQIVLGGITVLVELHPAAVAGHFVLSMVLVACATTLVWRAGTPPGPYRRVVGAADEALARVALLAAAALMITGPVVTGSGPHAGDARSVRFGFAIPDVVRVHSINMWIFLVAVVVVLFRLARSGAPEAAQRRGRRLLAATVAQGAIGFWQYDAGIPAWLVTLHIVGATAVVALSVWFVLGLRRGEGAEVGGAGPAPTGRDRPAPSARGAAAGTPDGRPLSGSTG